MFKSKLAAGIVLFVFFALTTSLLAAGMIVNYKNGNSKGNPTDSSQLLGVSDSNEQNSSLPNESMDTLLSAELVSAHNNAGDCWIIISDSVYSVTSYLNLHPGGVKEMLNYCGKDATNAFGSKDKNPPVSHSRVALNLLKDFYIGKLGDTIKTTIKINLPTSTDMPTTRILPSAVPTTPPAPVIENKTVNLTASEVAIHNNQIDCWMIISGNVYNLTSYVSQHPGGLVLVSSCGKDGTSAFQTRGGSGTHSAFANNLLSKYLLGPVNSTTSAVPAANGASTANPTPISSQGQNPILSSDLPAPILSKYPNATFVNGKYEDEGEWEGKINVSGACRAIKINSSGSIVEDKNC